MPRKQWRGIRIGSNRIRHKGHELWLEKLKTRSEKFSFSADRKCCRDEVDAVPQALFA